MNLQITVSKNDPNQLEDLLTSNVGVPFSGIDWPRGTGATVATARAKILMDAGIKALRGWRLSSVRKEPFRILSCDGGGYRGLYSAIILGRLEDVWLDWLTSVDFFAGTSTGAIVAMGLACGYSPKDMADLYRLQGKDIFSDSIGDDIRDLGKLIGAEWDNKNLKRALEGLFGNKKLGEIKKTVLVVAFDLDVWDRNYNTRTWKPRVFNNYEDEDLNESVVDVLMATCAAPTYFPTYNGFIDGGVAANNPAMCAVAGAIKMGISIPDIRLLSVGTGKNPQYIEGDHDWGQAQWVMPITDMLMDGGMDVVDYQCKRVLGEEHYLRLNTALETRIELGDVSKSEEIERAANAVSFDRVKKDFWKITE